MDIGLGSRESHLGWCDNVVTQTHWTNPWCTEYDALVRDRVGPAVGRARKMRGHGVFDYPVSQTEVSDVVSDWDTSWACTPDLIPRLVFLLGHQTWDVNTWLLQRLCGPSCLAVRPWLWRFSHLVPLWKKGSVDLYDDYRLIMVKVQLA